MGALFTVAQNKMDKWWMLGFGGFKEEQRSQTKKDNIPNLKYLNINWIEKPICSQENNPPKLNKENKIKINMVIIS